MAKVNNPMGDYFYMDNRLSKDCDKIINRLKKKDKDAVFIVDGAEGSGKSVFAFQLAARVDPSFNVDRVVFNAEDFKKVVRNSKKGSAIVFDEAFRGLSSRASLSKTNTELVAIMMEMRQRNLMIIIVLPTYFMLDKYVSIFRSVGLFHIYTNQGKRGFFVYFNKAKKKLMYIYGKKEYRYSGYKIPKSNFKGRFLEQYTIDEKKYRKKKSVALSYENIKFDNPLYDDRNKLLWALKEYSKMSLKDMSEFLKKFDVNITYSQISRSINSVKK